MRLLTTHIGSLTLKIRWSVVLVNKPWTARPSKRRWRQVLDQESWRLMLVWARCIYC